jgi:hypothetical protein
MVYAVVFCNPQGLSGLNLEFFVEDLGKYLPLFKQNEFKLTELDKYILTLNLTPLNNKEL